ncbi:glycosyltransferase family 2 protein [Devosia sp.]|uniref:glycosyltransferase family 2 protein n=1 Tax=Devosia sp. TaxID=1871048 RepID=UPI0026177760|nr:glycosyltransferase family 2 protein [Devosia sp.]
MAVVIVTYNSADVLPGLLDSLEAGLAGAGPFAVIVVDNDSRDDSAALAEAHPLGVQVIRSGRNGGYAAGINLAAVGLPAGADMLILNPDIRLCPGAARKLMDCAANEWVGVAAPMILNVDGSIASSLRREPTLATTWIQAFLGPSLAGRLGVGDMIANRKTYVRAHAVDWATGAVLLVTARARERVGAWDESFFLYSEEVEYQRRVRSSGLYVMYAPDSHVTHIGGDYMQSPALTSVMTSNQIRYYARYHGPLATALFRGALIAFGLLRAWRSRTHRAVLRVAVSPLRPARDYMLQAKS